MPESPRREWLCVLSKRKMKWNQGDRRPGMQDGSAKQQTSGPGCGERPASGVRSGGEAKADEEEDR